MKIKFKKEKKTEKYEKKNNNKIKLRKNQERYKNSMALTSHHTASLAAVTKTL